MSNRIFRLTGALRGALAAAPGALPGVARRTRAGLAAHTAVVRRIKQCLSVLALMAVAAVSVGAGSASAATQRIAGTKAERHAAMAAVPGRGTGPAPVSPAIPRIAKSRAQWKADIGRVRQPGTGCYRASYPVLRWHAARCVRAPRVPLRPRPMPRSARHAGPELVGNGVGYSAQVSGLISQATGTFQDVSPGITEQGPVNGPGSANVANAFSLQLNSQFFSGSPACAGSSDPSNCQAWQQFVYNYSDAYDAFVYIQYWLLNYGATCPSGWNSDDSGSCVTNSPAAFVNPLTASQLGNVALTGTATSGGDDGVSLTVGDGASLITTSDSVLDLASFWNTTEWGVYGDGDLSEAYFGPGTTLTAQTALTATTPAAPSCVDEGFTGETNNLSLTSTPAVGSQLSSTMASEQTNGTTGAASCSTAAAANPALVGVVIGGVAYVKEGGLSAPWVQEYSGVSQLAVASDPVNGPLIGVLTTGGVLYVKEGSLYAPWVKEATGVSQISLASDPVNGPVIGMVTTGGVAYVTDEALSLPWVELYSGVSQIAVASDAVNGQLIGVLTDGGTAYVREAQSPAPWTDEYSNVSQISLASDPAHGPLIGVLTDSGVALAKEGGLSATWVNEYSGVSQIAVASDAAHGPLIGVVTTGGVTYVKEGGLSAQWNQEISGWLALASDRNFGPLISVLTPGGVAYAEEGVLQNGWVDEENGVSQVVSAG